MPPARSIPALDCFVLMNRENLKPKIFTSVAWGIALGIFIGAISIYVAMITDNSALQLTFAEVMFPYYLAVDPTASHFYGLLIALIQWPLYGALIGYLWGMRKRRTLLIGGVLILLVLHILLTAEAKRRRDAFYGPKMTAHGPFNL
jgi:hypothetical protein